MNKKAALFLAFSLTFLIAGNYYFFSPYFNSNSQDLEEVKIIQSIDGDTIRLEDGRVVRFLNINTPEKGEFGYNEAKSYMKKFENSTVQLQVTGVDKYQRMLGRIYAPDYLNLVLVQEGFAHTFLVIDEEKNEFDKAQDQAIKNGKSIWQHSPYYECLKGKINKLEESVIITNECNTSISGWTLADESRKKYVFKQIGEEKFVLYSDKGQDNQTTFYWNQGNVWNNDRDSIIIRDSNSLLVFYDSYGY